MIHYHDNVAYLSSSRASVFISEENKPSTPVLPKIVQMEKKLDVAPWGEDNKFPQNIVTALEACGIAQSTLKRIASSLWGGGLIYGKVIDIDAGGNEVFQQAKPGDFVEVDKFWKENRIPRYFAESTLDWAYYANCFPELILNKAANKIVRIVHQESCDCRFKQMDESGAINTVYISKLWGATKEQFVRFDRTKSVGNSSTLKPDTVDSKYVHSLPAIDPYFPLDSLRELINKRKKLASFILPLNFPSPNKTYYQLASWDGARVSGWIDIASRVPNMLKIMYEKSFSIRYHIEIPERYFERRFGEDVWKNLDAAKKKATRLELLEAMDKYLAGDENAEKTFVSYFEIDHIDKKEFGRIKITPIETTSKTDKDLLTSGTANSEIMIAMGVNPNTIGAGKPGGVYASNQGGSNIREGKLEHDSSLALERQLLLEPFQLIKEFNEWPDELQFRFKDTVLLTLDKGKQTETKIS